MNPLLRRQSGAMALAGILVLIAAPASGAIHRGDLEVALAVEGITIAGSEVRIEVSNLGASPRSGTVYVRARLGDRDVVSTAAVTVSEGQRAFVRLVLPGTVDDVVEAGIVLDDGCPF